MIRVKTTTGISPRHPANREDRKNRQDRKSAGFGRPALKPAFRARGRRGESLASARDRHRLRERNRAERARVEGMLANVAAPIERRVERREATATQGTVPRRHSGLRTVQPVGCPVCGDERVVTDEVMYGGTLRMSECLNCEHRWTERPKGHWAELGARMNRDWAPRPLRVMEH